ncbi:hypothetical protein ACFFRR_005286 [Megaselia abdita]
MDIFSTIRKQICPLQRIWYKVLLAKKIVPLKADLKKEKIITYQDVCRNRYTKSFKKYNNRFVQEIKNIENCQPRAIDAMRLHRSFAITTLWPPMHSNKEIHGTLNKLENILNSKDRRHLKLISK